MASEDEVQTLIRLGLTSCQARVFLALSRTESLTAYELSKIAKVTRQDVYRIIPTLQGIGLVEKILEKPIRFKALPMKEAMGILLNRRNRETDELERKVTELVYNVDNALEKNAALESEPQFVIVPPTEVIIKKLQKAIRNTNKSIDITTSFRRFKFASYNLSKDLEKALKRGAKVRAIIDKTTAEDEFNTLPATWSNASTELKYFPTSPKTVMAIYDKKEVFIFIDPSADLKESAALWSNAPSLVHMAQEYFETIWEKAQIVNTKP